MAPIQKWLDKQLTADRLALSHNLISTFPSRFSECTSLRYLNVRNNVIREFPLAVCAARIHISCSIGLHADFHGADMRTLIARNIGPWSKQASSIAAGTIQADIAESSISPKEPH